MASQLQWWPFGGSSTNSTRLCENCGVRPKFQNHDYCGRACSTAAETRRNSAAQAANAQGPPTSGARQDPFTYSLSSGPNGPTASNMCENCLSRAKSQETDEDGTVITHLYCGIRCYQASQQTSWPASTIPAPAAAFASHEPLTLRIERTNTPLGRNILLTIQERWKLNGYQAPKVKSIYRINLPGQVYRRFDLALQMNDGCPVRTTYYGGIAACSLADDANPTPCTSESCGLCDALRTSFGNLLHGESCSEGDYGPGLYTYSNPASAYHATVPADDLQPQKSNFVLIQCRVVAKADPVPSSNLYAGFIDESGVVFCTQPTAIIPTHVLICNAIVPPKGSQHTIPVNSTSASLGSAPSTATPMAGGIGQVDTPDTGGPKPKPLKGNKGKGKARAKPLPQKPQEKGSGLASSSKQQPGADLTESAAANQGVLKIPQPGGSNIGPQVVPTPKTIPGAIAGADSSANPTPSYGEAGAAGAAMPPAVYQANLASAAPGCFYVHNQDGFIPIPNPPPPGVNLYVLGVDGNFYPGPSTTATLAYPPISVSVLSPGSAPNQGLFSTPAPDPATAALRALDNLDPEGSPPGPRAPHVRIEEDDALGSITTKDGKTPPREGVRLGALMSKPEVSLCLLQGCNKRVLPDSVYCSLGHARDAVVRGEADACVRCKRYAKTPGFPTCSKICGGMLASERRLSGGNKTSYPSSTYPSSYSSSYSTPSTTTAPRVPSRPAGGKQSITYPCGCTVMMQVANPPIACPICQSFGTGSSWARAAQNSNSYRNADPFQDQAETALALVDPKHQTAGVFRPSAQSKYKSDQPLAPNKSNLRSMDPLGESEEEGGYATPSEVALPESSVVETTSGSASAVLVNYAGVSRSNTMASVPPAYEDTEWTKVDPTSSYRQVQPKECGSFK